MEKIKLVILLMILTITMSLVPITGAYGETLFDYEAIYNQGVEENYINPEALTLEDWLTENVEHKKICEGGWNEEINYFCFILNNFN